MAKAKEMLDELKDNAPEADPFPTIRESLAELGANPDKYEKILAKSGENLHWEKVFSPKTTLEAGAITLLAAAKQSGAEPNEYLSRLAPYFDSRIQSLPDMYNASGYVSGDAPKRAVLTRTARELKGSAYTLPHELEHTLQGIDGENFLPLYGPLGSDTKRFGAYDRNKDRLQEALSKIPVEEREQITAKHPIFGRYLSQGNELFARIRAKDMLDSAKGGDFLQTEMGQKLFPTDRDRSYFIGSTLPGVPTITPPYTFESTDKNKKPLTDPKTSYARQLFNALTEPKEYQDGGEVTDEFPEEAGAMPGQNPSEAAKRLLYYKKTAAPTLPPGVVPDTGQLDGIYQDPNVASETARVFGMQPREDRLTILPRYSRETGLVAPEMLYDAARAVTAPSVAARGYEVAPEEAVNMALNFTGAGLGTSTAMKKPMGEGGIDLAMNAYHGSPYDIPGKFDVSKAGTGTGAQQYGHGVYFAEARPTAERFKKGAKQKGFDFKAEEEALGIELPTNARSHFMILSQQMPDNPALDPLQAAELILSKNPEARNIPKEKLANLFEKYQEKTQGNLYQVDIPDQQVAKMLDWNKPLSQQSPEVLDILKKLPAIQEDLRAGKTLDDLKGGNAYQAIAASFNVRQNEAYKLASEFLNAQGIPGLRYDDYYAPGQSNFVVFDPSMVKMLMRNDKPVSTLPSSTTAREDLTKLLGYSEDIPNEKWLANKIEDAVDGGKNSFGVPRRMGSITGYFEKPVEIPVELLSKLPGERGEQSNVRKDSLDYIRKNWDKVSKEPPYIEVDPFGKAWVSEGNHRIMVAKELGLKTLPVEIRYFSGGQRKAGELAPEKILEYNKPK